MADYTTRGFLDVIRTYRGIIVLVIVAVLTLPGVLLILPNYEKNTEAAGSTGEPRAPQSIGTTLAFDDAKVVTIQYSQIYFCNSAGPPTSATNSPCAIGKDATIDPVPDSASNTLEVIVPLFVNASHPFGNLTPSSPSNTITGLPGSNSLVDPTLGANNLTQCPGSTLNLSCINHPHFVDLVGTGVIPLPIHSHIISGHGTNSAQGGWWELKSWLVKDPTIWPNPSTGACSAGTGCLTSEAALQSALQNGKVIGPSPTSIYLFFNVVGSSAH